LIIDTVVIVAVAITAIADKHCCSMAEGRDLAAAGDPGRRKVRWAHK
jgi:hypothetical protein